MAKRRKTSSDIEVKAFCVIRELIFNAFDAQVGLDGSLSKKMIDVDIKIHDRGHMKISVTNTLKIDIARYRETLC
jgi:hypothetical protein